MLKYAKKSTYSDVQLLERLECNTDILLFDLKKIDKNYSALKKHLTNFTIHTVFNATIKIAFTAPTGVRL